jgi:23S rRNA (guanosine2251-2'-O)-methyltransferase
MGHDRHQGVAAQVEMPPYAEMDDLFHQAQKRKEAPFFALLDGVQDPQNLGAIIRSADGAGVHGSISPKDNAVGYTPAVLKASAGAAAYVPVVQVTNLVRTMNALKEAGLWLTGTDHTGDRFYTEIDYKGPLGIVMGSEGKGLRRLVLESCDFLAAIPMKGHVNSLNVSVASALMFFEARRQRML